MVRIEKFSVVTDYEAEDSCLLNVLFQFSTTTYVNARMIIIPNGTTFPAKQKYLQDWRRMGSP
jgi:hypothetical protein